MEINNYLPLNTSSICPQRNNCAKKSYIKKNCSNSNINQTPK